MTTPQSWIQLRAFKSVFTDETTETLMTTRQKFQELSSSADQPTTKRDV